MNLDNFKIGKACLTDAVFLGKVSKDGKTWLHKKDITSEFLATIIDYVGENIELTVTGRNSKDKYTITVKKTK